MKPPLIVCDGGNPPECDVEVIPIDVGYGKVAIVDVEDAEIASSKRWRLCNDGREYAYAYEGKQKVYLHRVIAGAPDGLDVDHRDGNKLNDRRSNLRIVTPAQNNQNITKVNGASGIRGVRATRKGQFSARVKVNGREHHLGTFSTAEMARAAAEDGRRLLMTHSAESTTKSASMMADSLSAYLAGNCIMCERKSPFDLHLTCVVLSHLTAVRSTTGWVSYEDLRDAIGKSDDATRDRERMYSAIKQLRASGWQILNSQRRYRLVDPS